MPRRQLASTTPDAAISADTKSLSFSFSGCLFDVTSSYTWLQATVENGEFVRQSFRVPAAQHSTQEPLTRHGWRESVRRTGSPEYHMPCGGEVILACL
jgi:hypothetical protein